VAADQATANAHTLAVVGRDLRPEIHALASHDCISVIGEVRDPADHIAPAAVCIGPVQARAGMLNKLIEFRAMQKPIVATSVANDGIGATPDEHLILADEPADMAAAILDLFADPARAARMGAAARSFVEQTCTWEAYFLRLEAEMFVALDGSERSMPVPAPPGDAGMPAVDKSNRGHNPIYQKAPTTYGLCSGGKSGLRLGIKKRFRSVGE